MPQPIHLKDHEKDARLVRRRVIVGAVAVVLLTLVLVAILIMLPTLGIGDMNNLYKWLLNLNSVVMPLRYLWVFVAFIAVVRLAQKYTPEYVFKSSGILRESNIIPIASEPRMAQTATITARHNIPFGNSFPGLRV